MINIGETVYLAGDGISTTSVTELEVTEENISDIIEGLGKVFFVSEKMAKVESIRRRDYYEIDQIW